MVSTRSALMEVSSNVDESMGVRQSDANPQLSPVSSAKDIGREPNRNFGRLRLDRIVADPNQPRTEFDEADIQQMASSLQQTGQIQPIGVKWNAGIEKWVVITGERRFRAAQIAELATIDCYFEHDELDESQTLVVQLVENLVRKDLAPLDEARGYESLMKMNDWTGKRVAAVVGVSESRVSRSLALLDLPAAIQQKIKSGELSRSAAYELCKLDSESVQNDLAKLAVEQNLTKQQASNAVRQRAGKRTKASRGKSSKRQKELNKKLTFFCPHGIEIVVRVPHGLNYHHVLEAKDDFAEEIQLRANNGLGIF